MVRAAGCVACQAMLQSQLSGWQRACLSNTTSSYRGFKEVGISLILGVINFLKKNLFTARATPNIYHMCVRNGIATEHCLVQPKFVYYLQHLTEFISYDFWRFPDSIIVYWIILATITSWDYRAHTLNLEFSIPLTLVPPRYRLASIYECSLYTLERPILQVSQQ